MGGEKYMHTVDEWILILRLFCQRELRELAGYWCHPWRGRGERGRQGERGERGEIREARGEWSTQQEGVDYKQKLRNAEQVSCVHTILVHTPQISCNTSHGS